MYQSVSLAPRKFSPIVLLTFLVFFGCQSYEGAQTPEEIFERAQLEEHQGHYDNAVRWYKEAAIQGLPEAQLALAHLYQWGTVKNQVGRVIGTGRQDRQQAATWYRKAAEQYRQAASDGDLEAQVVLADLLFEGSGISYDEEEALRLYKEAAAQGNAKAQYRVAFIFVTKKEYSEAVVWLSKSAEQGFADAQYLFSEYYQLGRGVDQDFTEAEMWLRKAAEQGHLMAKRGLAQMEAAQATAREASS